MKDAAMTAGPKVVEYPVNKLGSSPYQRRRVFADEAEAEMAESMQVHGVIQPVVARWVEHDNPLPAAKGEKWKVAELVAGERRCRAARRAGLETVPVIFRDLTDREAAEICCLENLQREDLTVIEEAESLLVLVDQGITQEELGQRLGKSRQYVMRRLNLLGLPEGAKELAARGVLTMQTAEALLDVPAAERGTALAALMARGLADGQLPQRQALSLLKHNYVEPARRAARYEALRAEAEAAWPGAKWVPYGEAGELVHWNSGYAPAVAPPYERQLAVPFETAPTWAELAERHGAEMVIAAVWIEDYDADKDEPEEGEKMVGEYLTCVLVKWQPLVDAELAVHERFAAVCERLREFETALEEGVEDEPLRTEYEHEVRQLKRERGELLERGADGPCVFRGGKEAEESEDEQQAAAEEAAQERAKSAARAAELRGLVEELLAAKWPAKKEAATVSWVLFDGLAVAPDLIVTDLLGVFLGGGNESDQEEWDQHIEKVEKKLATDIKGPNGGAALLGRLMVAQGMEELLRWRPGILALKLREMKVIAARKHPELWAAAAKEEEKEGRTLQEEC